jgi:drug/metabolite transporter (DMT)-like permease
MSGARPMRAGGTLALASAFAFGATTPLVQRAGRGVGPFATAALLYAGAALFAVFATGVRSRRAAGRAFGGARTGGSMAPDGPARLRRIDLPRLAVVAALGAVVAPVALAWGLQRTSGITASLLLNLEAVFTVVLAGLVGSEPIGGRVGLALAAMTAGGGLLVAGAPSSGAVGWGALAVAAATLAWAADNTVGRPLADRDPMEVVLAKSTLGAIASVGLSAVDGERCPAIAIAAALGACGALGYGASLALYLRAQRAIGAARTGSIFATAPFVGAAIAWALGERAPLASSIGAGALFVVGLWLHLTEAHGHEHTHEAVEHSHAHSHDDQHHQHQHPQGATVVGSDADEHTHAHQHDRETHSHPHGLDLHHRHRH